MSTDFRGDPSSALLEVLDPEQNSTFNDHYLDVDYDLSKVMFITTANTLDGIPRPLQDRMEIIRIAGYTEVEKLQYREALSGPEAARGQRARGGECRDLRAARCSASIRHYTKEAGVRNLEREIAADLPQGGRRGGASKDREAQVRVNGKNLAKYLGPPRFRYGKAEEEHEIGMATGLAWTEMGGELLTTEVTVLPGKGKLIITGRLGDVMQESAQAAMSYVRSRADELGLDKDFYQKRRHPHSRSRRGDSEGWAVGGNHHGDRAGLGADAHSGAPRRRHDRGGDPARTRVCPSAG